MNVFINKTKPGRVKIVIFTSALRLLDLTLMLISIAAPLANATCSFVFL